MKNSEVQLWIALDKNKNYIFIENAIQGEDYYCPSCGGIVRARAINSDLVTEHFYHINKCNCNGGESYLHLYWKNNLINIGEKIYLPTVGDITCIDKRIEFTFNTKEGIYRPDLIIKTDNANNRFIIFEIYNTNKKDVGEYEDIWNELKYPVFEIDVKKLSKDKSNILDNLKLIHSYKRNKYIEESKSTIRYLYKKMNEITSDYTIPDDVQEYIKRGLVDEREAILEYNCKYDNSIMPLLSKYYRIFKNNLNTKIDIKLLYSRIIKKRWDKATYKDIVVPLLNIHKQFNNYIIY